jgi:hypothetical protein
MDGEHWSGNKMKIYSSRLFVVNLLNVRGLTANQIACALISIMARRSTRSNQKPDTLMQDRTSARSTNCDLTAGPYIWVRTVELVPVATLPLYPTKERTSLNHRSVPT